MATLVTAVLNGSNAYAYSGALGAAAAEISVPFKVAQLAVENQHATQAMTVGYATATTAAQALTNAAALGVTALANGFRVIPAGQRRVIFKTTRNNPTFVSLQAIAAGASTPIMVEGTVWFD